ncbi:GIY-YIG nuclease family protein [Methylovirgula sp. HY1]|uniref:GIY-YIG nuclease family protein n=1 Tax=Methylovirgula sp. HY1 TaxID=2822761 RepID=UPI00351D80FC
MDGAFIYFLRCSDGSYYTGITRRSVDERVSEHAQGLVDSYTARRLPVALLFSEYSRVSMKRSLPSGASKAGRVRRRKPICAGSSSCCRLWLAASRTGL